MESIPIVPAKPCLISIHHAHIASIPIAITLHFSSSLSMFLYCAACASLLLKPVSSEISEKNVEMYLLQNLKNADATASIGATVNA